MCPLDAQAAKVTRIGHSMSLVEIWFAAVDETGNWVPDDERAELKLSSSKSEHPRRVRARLQRRRGDPYGVARAGVRREQRQEGAAGRRKPLGGRTRRRGVAAADSAGDALRRGFVRRTQRGRW
jgi:hypothetical protein